MIPPRKPRVLIVYYSGTGNTERVARRLTELTDATVEAVEVLQSPRRSGLVGLLISGYEAAFGRPTRIAEPRNDPRSFDLLLVGSPVWNSSLSSPVLSYLRRTAGALPPVAFFVTYGGRGAEQVLEQMSELTGKRPLASLALLESELKTRLTLKSLEFWQRILASRDASRSPTSLRLLPGGLASTP